MQIADGHGRRAADARGAVEIYGVAFGEQLAQGLDAVVELGAKFHLLFDDGNAAKKDRTRLVVGFERRPIQNDRPHVVVGLQIEDGGHGDFPPEAFDIVNRAGMRADKQPRKDLCVGENRAGESTHFSRFQVTTDCGVPLAVRDEHVTKINAAGGSRFCRGWRDAWRRWRWADSRGGREWSRRPAGRK